MKLYPLTSRLASFFIALAAPATSTLPRSTYPSNHVFKSSNHTSSTPPWNPSTGILPSGWLKSPLPAFPGDWENGADDIKGKYGKETMGYDDANEEVQKKVEWPEEREEWNVCFQARQVPGDGNCLFHSISLAWLYHTTGSHDTFHLNSSRLRRT
eukprot:CAMPEP_0118653052 /NCGR_PEP_ID=MMETSP0785-20121206/11635_1 /TAXON_ID=91992 /ORGANISM="Bolidomonas pacifica, Strain CCMP 1866" /LENGTH=154 /DNA_ID=CAMNT_0006545589 /DNA_START=186 /DNA_END=647 /DNA_ORIENTATION=+